MNTNRPKQYEVLSYVKRHPGCPKLHAALYCAPGPIDSPSIRYGYNTVNRAITNGLITAKAGKGNSYALFANE